LFNGDCVAGRQGRQEMLTSMILDGSGTALATVASWPGHFGNESQVE
jgi:hypothetical protein